MSAEPQKKSSQSPANYKIRLAQLRKEKKLSQKQLADQLGVAQNTISQWETQQREIDNNYLKKLCSLFGVSADYLLGIPAVWSATQYEQYSAAPNAERRTLLAKWGCPADIQTPPASLDSLGKIDVATANMVEQILSRPDLMSLFNLLNDISKEDLEKTIKVLDALKSAE